MGAVLSSIFNYTGESSPPENSRVKSFHSSDRFQLHFNELKSSSQLDVAKEFQVQAMPTFVLVKKGKEIDRVVGAKKDELERKIEKHRA